MKEPLFSKEIGWKIMRLTVLQFFIVALFTNVSLALDSRAQEVLNKKISVELNNKSVSEVLSRIEKAADIKFSYSPDLIQSHRSVNLNAANERLDLVLRRFFQPLQIKFELVGNRFILTRASRMEPTFIDRYITLVMPSKLESGRPLITVTGLITDETGGPVPSATILLKGTPNVGTVTNADGRYTLNIPDGNATIVVSSIGYVSQEIQVANRTTIDVVLKSDIKSLNEVVVVGYGTQRRQEVTSSVATIKTEDFNQGGTRSPLDLIQGKVAGLQITRASGNNPNSSASIQLRGIVSINGDRSPLVVIDGIPGGNLDLLQQDDIESFDVLKDGSAAAIYGTRGNAGVILITTKKGKGGAPTLSYSTYAQREVITRRPQFLSASDWRAAMQNPSNPKASQMRDLGASTDFYDLLVDKKNISQYHNLALSGGSGANSNYRVSMYYNEANPIAIQNWRRQYGGRLSVFQKSLNNLLSTSVNLATNFNKANLLGGQAGDFENALGRNPTQPLFDNTGRYYEEGSTVNPIGRLAQEKLIRDQQTTSADVRFSLEPFKGFKASAFGAIQHDVRNDNEYRPRDSRRSILESLNGTPIAGTGYARKYNYVDNLSTFESTLEYETKFAEHHGFKALAGYSYQYRVSSWFEGINSGFLNDQFQENNLGAGNFIALGKSSLGSFKEDNKLVAFFGRLNYDYKGKYIAQFILRREGSSRFGANNKFGNFPAASVGWNLAQENFIKSIQVFDDLKLRAGYGITGNQGIPNYRSLVRLGTGNFYLNDDGVWRQTYGPGNNPNPNLRWERKAELNIGLDFALFKGRLSGTFDVYRRRTSDLLGDFNTQLPPYIQSTLFTNVGTIDNNGIELSLSGSVIKKKDFSWNVDLVGSTQKNRLVSLSSDVFKATYLNFGAIGGTGALGDAIRTIEGGSLGSFYGKRFAGFTPEGRWLFYKASGEAVTSDKIVANEDYTYIGNGIPKFLVSWNNNLRYKNFDLTVFFRGKLGYDILNLQQAFFGNKVYLPTNVLKDALGRNNQINDALQYSDYYLEPGGFVKLDNVTLGYNWKFNSPVIKNLRLYATGRNLLTITKYRGVDPDIEDTGLAPGIDGRGFYPRTQSYTLGLNVQF
ncbi:SusC/RagA family TonB-linked outer membrane protein [Siphonobacter sp. SORGH_AS_1065]|uniref:SusC/RagA family TonB-linked outer membrane protein n=1 Tax=Siphonobacter sp. SORGH_AS_1065 TaxID=3041795 RepID=UPI002789187A|nr:SusC/RagA family TonB-linked outer membrane protein [Siphonobacter sp. SORGH_AS_1065]MDQ1086694.1 TonB-linked SusC/RagA family outer membrane protein [Siphonobacter sp. SORGH_AS_1065]